MLDRAGRATATDRDIVGRPVRVTDAAGGVVQYLYDPMGNLTNLVDQAGTVTTWTYDPEGRQTRKTYADGSHYDYAYDALGRLLGRTDAKNLTTTYAYDPNGNLTNILYPDASTVTFAYDALNRKTSMSDSIGTATYAYDILGNLVTEDGPFANDTLYYDYTPANQLAAITSSFYNVEYAYDTLGRLSTVIGAEGTNTYAYTTAGTLWTNLTLANGTTAERQFDALLRLTNLVNRADAGDLSSFALTLDDADQRTQVIREDGKIYTYSYDAIGQLTNAAATLPDGTPWTGYQFSYSYDATGNPVEQNKNGLVYSNSFNNLNQNAETRFAGGLAALGTYSSPLAATVTVNNVQAQLYDGDWAATGIPFVQGTNALFRTIQDLAGRSSSATSTVVVADRAYAYDANGNMTANGAFTYVWDAENRLTEVWKNGILVQSNRYDALWRRREKIEYAPDGTAVTNRYIYKDWLVLAITDGDGSLLETYTHGADLSSITSGVGGILAASQTNGAVCYHYDYIGNVTELTSSLSMTLFKGIYSSFGQVLCLTSGITPRFQFSTKEFDRRIGCYYYGYRFYDSQEGRFLNRDPIEEMGGDNLYVPFENNPINEFDSYGLISDFKLFLMLMDSVGSKWHYLVCIGDFIKAWNTGKKAAADFQALVNKNYKCCTRYQGNLKTSECCEEWTPIEKYSMNGGKRSWSIGHQFWGCEMKKRGVRTKCLGLINLAFEAKELVLNKEYSKFDNGFDYLHDTWSDMKDVYDAFWDAPSDCSSLVPGNCESRPR